MMNDDNFLSIDRLVEFGLGVSVAQQMVNSMNHMIQNTIMPGLQTPFLSNGPTSFHVILDGKPAGPFSESELSRLITEGKVRKESHVWYPGMAQWDLVERVPAVLRLVALAPPPFHPEG
ncbi:MAG: DUF4339 domain-containing protein [Zoogloea sp.]|nr:MAG: DUF4339 domain-containing protein [Zoogloea sp.]